MSDSLILENRHTGERLELRRMLLDGEMCLELRGSLPPRSEGPPLHVHLKEHEVGTVQRGRLTAVVDGRRIEAGPGETAELPLGSAHRWWNEGDEPLEFVGYARPIVDLDRYLQAVFEIVNAGPAGRPSPVYMAHVMRRHRETQAVRLMPAPLQAALFRLAYLVGSLTGAYRADDWPGCPSRCSGAPLVDPDEA
ncbi:MAG: cupin domain-containing protein [Longimicrobiales bacterium]